MEELGTILKRERKRFGLTLRDVQEKTSISNAYLSQLENGKIKKPSPKMLIELARCYEMPYEKLMLAAGHPVPDNPDRKGSVRSRFSSSFADLSEDEEEKLKEYLQFLRSRKR